MKRIFAPFSRLENADTQEGFGLGLSIAKALSELLGGRIDVESHVGFGSQFTVTIPVVEGDEKILQLADKSTAVLPEGLRIAVVDDDVTVLRMTVEMLTKKNVQAVGCPTVDDLFDRMRQSDYDLIITDIKLGGISGFDLLELLRDANIGNSKTIPMLAMTGRTERKAEDFIEAGFSGCLLKPFSYAERPPRKMRLKKRRAGSQCRRCRCGFPLYNCVVSESSVCMFFISPYTFYHVRYRGLSWHFPTSWNH